MLFLFLSVRLAPLFIQIALSSGGWAYLKIWIFCVALAPVVKRPTRKTPGAPVGQSDYARQSFVTSWRRHEI